MPSRFCTSITYALLIALIACSSLPALGADTSSACFSGTYALKDGNVVDVQALDETRLTWHALDGRFGTLSSIAKGRGVTLDGANQNLGDVSFGSCADRSIKILGSRGNAVPLVTRETKFQSGTASLVGRLVLPPGEGKVTIIVFGPGFERRAATEYVFQQRLFPAAGVGFFVYDQRGTGGSDGTYTQNFDTLAQDAVAAVAEARRLAGQRVARLGFSGVSEAGWVLPLAATRTPVDFIIVNGGVPGTLRDKAWDETTQDLTPRVEALLEAQKIADAVETVMRARGAKGLPELYAAVGRYRREAWFKDLKTGANAEVVALATRYTEKELREIYARRDWSVEPSWEADSVAPLRQLSTPVLWMIGSEDPVGSSGGTSFNLVALRREGKPVTLMLFRGADHELLEYRAAADGKRTATRYAEDARRLELDFAKNGAVKGRYGSALYLQ